jgi:glycosyltransferase involved in cell wall biosynthesis
MPSDEHRNVPGFCADERGCRNRPRRIARSKIPHRVYAQESLLRQPATCSQKGDCVRICILAPYAIAPDESQRIAAGERPRMEQIELACRLKAELIDRLLLTRCKSLLVRFGCSFSAVFGLALLAWLRKRDFDLFYASNENLGLLLAALFKLARQRPRLVVANHHLSNSTKAFLFSRLRLENSTDALICLNEYQAAFLERELAVPPNKVLRINNGGLVDGSFFSPLAKESSEKTYILSVGRENRDYETLVQSLRTCEIPAKLVSSGIRESSEYRNKAPDTALPNLETFEHIPFTHLRALYEGCSFVVLPMHNVDYPAGMTAVMEAMAMGKAVIATYSRGIEEFIEDSVTGFWTEPGNHLALREKIMLLWNNPELAGQMGERARESVKSRVDMTRFVTELETILMSVK